MATRVSFRLYVKGPVERAVEAYARYIHQMGTDEFSRGVAVLKIPELDVITAELYVILLGDIQARASRGYCLQQQDKISFEKVGLREKARITHTHWSSRSDTVTLEKIDDPEVMRKSREICANVFECLGKLLQ